LGGGQLTIGGGYMVLIRYWDTSDMGIFYDFEALMGIHLTIKKYVIARNSNLPYLLIWAGSYQVARVVTFTYASLHGLGRIGGVPMKYQGCIGK
jgi:hypothetical protein